MTCDDLFIYLCIIVKTKKYDVLVGTIIYNIILYYI